MQNKLIPTVRKAKQIKKYIGQGQNTTTYILRARNDKQRISQTLSRDKTQPHTPWEQGMKSRGSARHPAGTKHNHIHAEIKEWQAEDQPDIQQGQNTTTYTLRARNDKQRISQTSSRDKTQPHTSRDWGMTSRGSARHPVGTNTTTYTLRLRNDKQRISQTSSRDKAQPHTRWEQGMTSRGSARHPAGTKLNHIHAESKEWQAEDQPDIQQG